MTYFNNKAKLAAVLLCITMLWGCADGDAPNASPETTLVGYDSGSATHISLGSRISISGSGAELQKNVITIFEDGVYTLEGQLNEGQLIVDALDADVRIVLNNAHIACSYSAALYVRNASVVTITLAAGTQNSLSDANARPSDDSIDGALYSKAPLVIDGSGSLSVSGAYKHGICSKDSLSVRGGSISISALKTALDSRGDMDLSECSFDIVSGTNGMRSGSDDSAADITIQSGTYSILSEGDGIQSHGNIRISDGTISVITGGGSAKAPVKESQFSADASHSQSAETTDDTSRKAIKAARVITISGGSLIIDAYDDGIHADGSITYAGGSCSISSGDDGIHAEDALLVSGGSIDIPYCFEGMEGKSITVTNGVVNIHANDDGINTAADETSEAAPQMSAFTDTPSQPPEGSDFPQDFTPPAGTDIPEDFAPPQRDEASQSTMPRRPDAESDSDLSDIPGERQHAAQMDKGNRPGGFGGFGGMANETPQDGVDITISGGTVTVSAQGDCMDSNGNIYITGGTVYVSTKGYPVISAAEAGLDCNGTLSVSGGSLVGTGSSASDTQGLEDCSIVYYGNTAYDGSTPITISDSSGNTLFEFSPVYSFNSLLIASPYLTEGETYSVTIGDTKEEITLTEHLLTVGENSGGFGGGRGGNKPFNGSIASVPSANIPSDTAQH